MVVFPPPLSWLITRIWQHIFLVMASLSYTLTCKSCMQDDQWWIITGNLTMLLYLAFEFFWHISICHGPQWGVGMSITGQWWSCHNMHKHCGDNVIQLLFVAREISLMEKGKCFLNPFCCQNTQSHTQIFQQRNHSVWDDVEKIICSHQWVRFKKEHFVIWLLGLWNGSQNLT